MHLLVEKPGQDPYTIAVMVPALAMSMEEIKETSVKVIGLTEPEPLEEGFAVKGE